MEGLIAMVVTFTQLAKKLGLKGDMLVVLAALLGGVFNAINFLGFPVEVLLQQIAEGVIIGLSTAGAVSLAKDELPKLLVRKK